MNTVLSVLAILISAATAVFVGASRRSAQPGPSGSADLFGLPEDALGLRHEVAALKAEAASGLKNLAVVRYDAFEDSGGRLSWSLAVLDDLGNGVVLTSIHGRSEARTYAKSISSWTCEQPLSPEETDAVAHARG